MSESNNIPQVTIAYRENGIYKEFAEKLTALFTEKGIPHIHHSKPKGTSDSEMKEFAGTIDKNALGIYDGHFKNHLGGRVLNRTFEKYSEKQFNRLLEDLDLDWYNPWDEGNMPNGSDYIGMIHKAKDDEKWEVVQKISPRAKKMAEEVDNEIKNYFSNFFNHLLPELGIKKVVVVQALISKDELFFTPQVNVDSKKGQSEKEELQQCDLETAELLKEVFQSLNDAPGVTILNNSNFQEIHDLILKNHSNPETLIIFSEDAGWMEENKKRSLLLPNESDAKVFPITLGKDISKSFTHINLFPREDPFALQLEALKEVLKDRKDFSSVLKALEA